jgi:CHAD domain-containing protein
VAMLFSKNDHTADLEHFTRVQEVLGQVHDAAIALELLRTAPTPDDVAARPLHDRLRRIVSSGRATWQDLRLEFATP